jgi:hypothetical protein
MQEAGVQETSFVDEKKAAEDLEEIVEFLEVVLIEEPAARERPVPPPIPEAARRVARG